MDHRTEGGGGCDRERRPAKAGHGGPEQETPQRRGAGTLRRSISLVQEWASGRPGMVVVGLLLLVKVAMTTWNAATYDLSQYDRGLHTGRARSGGLALEGRAYNPPLYYMPALAFSQPEAPQADRERALLQGLRYTNVLWLTLLYSVWIFGIIPKVFTSGSSRVLASLLLLAVPGFQKLGAMAHPDNALAGVTALAVLLVLRLWGRAGQERAGPKRFLAALALAALVVGLAALTRPFGHIVCIVLWLGLMAAIVRRFGWLTKGALLNATVATVIVGGLMAAWPGYQYAVAGRLVAVHNERYIRPFLPHRAGFDLVGYFTSFHYLDLLRQPNRWINHLSDEPSRFRNPYGNSFWTLAFSEFWGDHWLYFSGARTGRDGKVWPKRFLFVVALPLTVFWGLALMVGLARLARDLARRRNLRFSVLLLWGLVALGAAGYVYFLTHGGLLPGKNSTVKFIYVSYLVPALAVLATPRQPSPTVFMVGSFYVLMVFAFALPLALHWPLSWL